MQKLTILVTGGAGFIGSHIADRYIAAGHEVIIIDNLSNGKKEHINPNVIKSNKFYQTDITNLNELSKIFQNSDYLL